MELFIGDDGAARCGWAAKTGMLTYHDTEWGFPVADDSRLFEKVCLEAFQCGLSWGTILAKRPAFREAFAGFRFDEVAGFGADDVARLMGDARIVRNRAKIEATIANAARAVELAESEGSLAAYFWRHEPAPDAAPRHASTTAASTALAKDLSRRGWRFVGPTTCQAFMQAVGLVNDHLDGCHVRESVAEARRGFVPPT